MRSLSESDVEDAALAWLGSEETVSESRTLSALRDTTLLPRLISGKMRVNDAEAVLDRAP